MSANEVIVGKRQRYLRRGRVQVISRRVVACEAGGRNEELGAPMDEVGLQRVELAYALTSSQYECDGSAVDT
jgi:hypothetical protein